MFDRIAPRYDRLNRVLSLGADAGWRRRAVAQAWLGPGERALDISVGTGDLAFGILRASAAGARVAGIDISPAMLAIASRRAAALGSDPDAYRYLPSSIEAFADPDEVTRRLRDAGFRDARYERLTFGMAAIHVGEV